MLNWIMHKKNINKNELFYGIMYDANRLHVFALLSELCSLQIDSFFVLSLNVFFSANNWHQSINGKLQYDCQHSLSKHFCYYYYNRIGFDV